MQIEMLKGAGGVFSPAFEHDLQRLTKFKNGELYTAEIKLTRNPSFHRKTFAFFNFCFQHWAADRVCKHSQLMPTWIIAGALPAKNHATTAMQRDLLRQKYSA